MVVPSGTCDRTRKVISSEVVLVLGDRQERDRPRNSSRSPLYFVFLTSPTISYSGSVSPAGASMRNMRPTGLPPPNTILANCSLTMATAGRVAVSCGRELAPGQQRRLQRAEIARTDRVEPGLLALGRRAAPWRVHGAVPAAAAERAERDLRDRHDARLRGDAFLDLDRTPRADVPARGRGSRASTLATSTPSGAMPGFGRQEVAQRLAEQQRADEQDERQRDLRHDEARGGGDAARRTAPCRGRPASPSAGGVLVALMAGATPNSRHVSTRERGREGEHVAVEAERQHDRLVLVGQERDQSAAGDAARSRARGRHRCRPAAGSPCTAARSRRTRDAPTAWRTAISRCRALARASSRFARLAHAMSRTSPATRQQDPQRILVRAVQRRQAGAGVLDDEAVLQVFLGAVRAVAGGQRLAEDGGRDAGQMCADARVSVPARLEAADHREPPGVRAFEATTRALPRASSVSTQIGRATSNWRPGSRPKNAGGVTPRIGQRAPVQVDVLPERRRVAAVLALPERVAQERARLAAVGLVLHACEAAAQRRTHAEHVEEVAADPQALGVPGLAAARQVESRRSRTRARR